MCHAAAAGLDSHPLCFVPQTGPPQLFLAGVKAAATLVVASISIERGPCTVLGRHPTSFEYPLRSGDPTFAVFLGGPFYLNQ